MAIPAILARIAGQLAMDAAVDFMGNGRKSKAEKNVKQEHTDPDFIGPPRSLKSAKPGDIYDELGEATKNDGESGFAGSLKIGLGVAAGNMIGQQVAKFLAPPEIPNPMSTLETYSSRDVGTVPSKMLGEAQRFGGNVSSFLNPLSGPGEKISSVLDITKQFAEMPAIVERWGLELSKSQEHLTKYNAQIAIAYTMSERRRIMRDIGSANRVSGSVAAREEALADLSDRLQSLRDTITNLINKLLTNLIRVIEDLLIKLEVITAVMKPQIDALVHILASTQPLLAALAGAALAPTNNNQPTNQLVQQFAQGIIAPLGGQPNNPLVRPAAKKGGIGP